MKIAVLTMAAILALTTAPALAQEVNSRAVPSTAISGSATDGWAPWDGRVQAPTPRTRPKAVPVTRIVAAVPAPITLPNAAMRFDRFWVIGSFR